MVEALSGGRWQGSSAKVATPTQTSWKELARATAGSGGSSSLTTSAFTEKENLMILYTGWEAELRLRFGKTTIDDGTKYSQRYQENFSGDGTNLGNYDYLPVNAGGSAGTDEGIFGVINGVNISGQEKLFTHNSVDNCLGTGAGTAPAIYERNMKYVNTTNAIDIARLYVNSGTMAEGSEIIVLGMNNDEADSGSNFWQVLKTTELTSASTTFSSGQISTTKKYLWIQVEYDQTSGGGVGIMKGGTGGTFGLGSIMSTRFSHDGAAAQSQESVSYGIVSPSSDGSSRVFVNCFIINPSGHEKLGISDGSDMASTGSGTAPDRTQGAFKWANTSAQLDIFNFSGADGGNLNNGKITIWGHD